MPIAKRAPDPVDPGRVAYALLGKSRDFSFDLAPAPMKIAAPLDVVLLAGTTATELLAPPRGYAALVKAAPKFEPGAVLDDLREMFLTKDDAVSGGILLLRRRDDTGWDAKMSKGTMPFVLSKDAVDTGVMPPAGESWLPASLSAVVPVHLRYWEATDPNVALAARNDLVASGLFADDLVKLVDGELRLCTIRHFLYAPDEAAPPAEPPSMAKSLAAVFASMSPDTEFVQGVAGAADFHAAVIALAKNDSVVLLTTDDEDGAVAISGTLIGARPAAAWLALAPDTASTRVSFSLIGKAFTLPDAPGYIFASSFAPACPVTWVGLVEAVKMIKQEGSKWTVYSEDGTKKLGTYDTKAEAVTRLAEVEGHKTEKAVRFLKADAPTDERYVLGIVLEPETVDAQNDVYDAATIRAAAHGYMENFATLKLMHEGGPIDEQVKILESYIAPVDFKVGDQLVKAGTWLMACKILDDKLWASAKAGGLTGFSIGGSALRAPDAASP